MSDDILHYSLSSDDMKRLVPTAKFIPYDQIHKYNNIDDLLGRSGMAYILYLIKNEHYGHWVCLYKTDNYVTRGGKVLNKPCLCYWNSYGKHPDFDLKYVPDSLKRKVFEYEPFLFNLMEDSPYTCYYNTHCLQGDGVSTCGDWASHRLMNRHLSNDQYAKEMKALAKKNGMTTDEVVATIIHSML